MERGKRRVNWDFHTRQCEKHFRGYLNLRIHPQEKTNKLQWERVTTWKSALVTVCWAEGVYCGGAGSWSCQVVIQTKHWILFRWLHFIWQYQELGMADSKPVWATWRQAGKEEPPRLFVCLCWNWLHQYMLLLLRLKNYFLSISWTKVSCSIQYNSPEWIIILQTCAGRSCCCCCLLDTRVLYFIVKKFSQRETF